MRYFFKLIFFSFLVLIALSLFVAFRPVQIGGGNYYYVVGSGSMTPALGVGDWIVCTKTNYNNIAVGDIIAFKHPYEPQQIIVHRVIEKSDTYLVTKGDACEGNDNFKLPPKNVLAVYSGFKVPYVGSILYLANHSLIGLVCVYYIPIGLLVTYQVRQLYKYFKAKK
jgi:signal peptidase